MLIKEASLEEKNNILGVSSHCLLQISMWAKEE